MRSPVSGKPPISDGFDVMRPIDNPKRPHGAVDFVVPYGTPLYAVEDGEVQYHLRIRSNKTAYNNDVFWPDEQRYAFRNYFYDWAGGLAIVYGKSGLTHVILHLDGDEVLRRLVDTGSTRLWHMRVVDTEVGKDEFILLCNLHRLKPVREGELLGLSGRAGDVRGDHVHYEIHRKRGYTYHSQRPNPEEILNL